MLIQIISTKSPKERECDVATLLKTVKGIVEEDGKSGVMMTGGSVTTQDMYGYVTYLFEVEGDASKIDAIGKRLCMALMPARWNLIDSCMKKEGYAQWQWSVVNKPSVDLAIYM